MQYYLNIVSSGYKNTMAALKTDIRFLVFKPEVDIMNNLYTKMEYGVKVPMWCFFHPLQTQSYCGVILKQNWTCRMCRYKRVNVEYEWSMDLKLQSWFHLHYAIPVVSSGNSEEQQKGHPKVFKCSVAPQTLTGVEFITNCRDKREVGGDKQKED